jgi:hypothetical protein
MKHTACKSNISKRNKNTVKRFSQKNKISSHPVHSILKLLLTKQDLNRLKLVRIKNSKIKLCEVNSFDAPPLTTILFPINNNLK